MAEQVFFGLSFQKGDRILTSQAEYGSNYLAYIQVRQSVGSQAHVHIHFMRRPYCAAAWDRDVTVELEHSLSKHVGSTFGSHGAWSTVEHPLPHHP